VKDAGNDTLVFARTRADGRSEGLVVDSRQLVDVLKSRVLEARGLGEVAELADQSSEFERGPAPAKAYVFTHRFAAPFQSLQTTLRLRALSEPEDGSLIYPLLGVLAASIVLGLLALYRMAATQVRFAERRNNFVSAVSHELKTPLTAIRMHAEMLEEDLVAGEPKRREYYRTITRESERLTRLIDNVLALAQIERRQKQLELRVGNICPIVNESVEVLRPHVESQGFQLEFAVSGNVPDVCFNPDALRQVLFNLVENALKYGRQAQDRRITIVCSGEGQGAVLSVRDRGPGVRHDQLRSVFEPFFRGEDELTRKHQGTGIGLSLVKGLAEAMGGRVRGENANPGFLVRLELVANR
jgi:signal transduction histidine kinase